MSQDFIVAGLDFQIQFCKKVNQEPFEEWEIAQMPLVNIENSQDVDYFQVNILAYIPVNFKTIPTNKIMPASIDLMPTEKNKIILSYNGVSLIKTPIKSVDGKDILSCRNFCIEYDSPDKKPIKYDLYHINLQYKLLYENGQSVEAIIVHNKNFDPETSRGTVTTTRH